MNIYLRVEMQKNATNIEYTPISKQMIQVNNHSAIDNYIIAKVALRDRFILRPQEYEIFINSAVEDIQESLDGLLKNW